MSTGKGWCSYHFSLLSRPYFLHTSQLTLLLPHHGAFDTPCVPVWGIRSLCHILSGYASHSLHIHCFCHCYIQPSWFSRPALVLHRSFSPSPFSDHQSISTISKIPKPQLLPFPWFPWQKQHVKVCPSSLLPFLHATSVSTAPLTHSSTLPRRKIAVPYTARSDSRG